MTAEEISEIWKKEIEELNINGVSRAIYEFKCFKMNRYYTNEDVLTDCYKVTFNFDGFSNNPCSEIYLNRDYTEWNEELIKLFQKKFGTSYKVGNLFKFENDICDYFQHQGYRFIIQFYLPGVISKLRQEKINKLLYGH
jgi:hypothetical protein